MRKRSNLIPITKIYDIYPKYTYSNDVKKFMDEIIDIDRADVYTKDEVVTMLTDIQDEIKGLPIHIVNNQGLLIRMAIAPSAEDASKLIQQKINELKAESEK